MSWKEELKNSITTIDELEQYMPLSPDLRGKLQQVADIHPMSITRYYMSLIDKSDPSDPLMRMLVPSIDELDIDGSYDTSGEKENTVLSGLQHKYSQTALVLSTNRCAAYCRFCFRKRLVGLPNEEIINMFMEAVEYIKKHEEITNVLITGGDPLILDTDVIIAFLNQLKDVKHLDFIRFGTRTPVVIPSRIYEDSDLLEFLYNYSNAHHQIYIVTHFNHPNEITPESLRACSSLRNNGIIMSNQTVLFRGVNDDPAVLADLMGGLLRMGVNPYYVFQCRPVSRVKKHFQVPLKEGYEIVEAAKARLNGHGKRFRYVMSHKTGKIEIVGVIGDDIYLKYHQAKNPENMGVFFKKRLTDDAGWLDDLE